MSKKKPVQNFRALQWLLVFYAGDEPLCDVPAVCLVMLFFLPPFYAPPGILNIYCFRFSSFNRQISIWRAFGVKRDEWTSLCVDFSSDLLACVSLWLKSFHHQFVSRFSSIWFCLVFQFALSAAFIRIFECENCTASKQII